MQVVCPDTTFVDNFIVAGPLNLNKQMMRADTIMGERLQLSPPQFRTLLMLVSNEGASIPFEKLHMFMTMPDEEKCSIQAARDVIVSLVNIVNISGRGFAKISILPGDEYVFETKWGMDWHRANETQETEANKKRGVAAVVNPDRFSKTFLSVAMVVALLVFMGLYFAYHSNDDGLVYIPALQIPLAEMPIFEDSITFPNIRDNVFYANADFGVYIDTYNTQGGNFVFMLYLKMADTSTLLSQPILVALGKASSLVHLLETLQPGRHMVEFTLRAFCRRLLTEVGSLSKQVVIYVE